MIEGDEMTNQDIKDLAPTMPSKYLQDFFAEKDIPEKTFEVEGKEWGMNFIPNTVVVEHIAQCNGPELEQIEDVLRKIDFANGDVNHFFNHLAGSIAR